MSLRLSWPRVAATMLGAALALVVTDLALRGVATGLRNRWHAVPLSRDAETTDASEVRYYHEGIARAHFSDAHARSTGARAAAGGPVGVLLGDSYVEALQVNDTETTGAVTERLARAQGVPLAVRQYGWSGATLQQYLQVAPQVLERWQPAWVAIMINSDDLTASAATTPPLPFPPSAPAPELAARGLRARVEGAARWVLERSPLAYELMLSSLELTRGAGGGAPEALQPADGDTAVSIPPQAVDVLRRLRDSYGARLVLLYVGQLPPLPSVTADPAEAEFLRVCAELQVRCVGTAEAMRRERDEHARLARGFTNSRPGVGHPNAVGHRLLGTALWSAVSNDGAR